MRSPRFPFAVALLLGVTASGPLKAAPLSNDDYVPGELLIQFKTEIPEAEIARAIDEAGGIIIEFNADLGYRRIDLAEGIDVQDAVDRFSQDPRVLWAEPNGYYQAVECPLCPQDPYLVDLPDGLPQNQWSAFKVGLFSLWRHGAGGDSSIVIAIVDTGIDDFANPHPDLAENVAGGHDFVGDDADPTDVGNTANLYGHGTHVAGIAAGVSNSVGIAGSAYCSKILVVRVLNCQAGDGCPGTYSDIADGVQWAADSGADVINMSLGGSSPSNTLRTAVQYAIGKGCIVLAASGNDAASQLIYPARYPELIAVGATDPNDDVASFSNYGAELDVVAPGVGIWSSFPGPTYVEWDGTSMATPLVSGIAALVRANNPSMRQVEMEAYLRNHTRPLTGANAEKDGYGRVDFGKLEDYSDAPAGYPSAKHDLFAYEWLGTDASAEAGLSDPNDSDFRPNLGGSHDRDGFDNGVFPGSFFYVPYLPPHIIPGFPFSLEVEMNVCRFDGPRYGADPSKQLHLDTWADWDGDMAWEEGASGEHVVIDHTEDPTTWSGNGKITTIDFSPVDEHILGNPVAFRSRLGYGGSVGSPDADAAYGEVEDDFFINFVEDFDVSHRVHTAGVYMDMGSWEVVGDPSNQCHNNGEWEFAWSLHPTGGAPCNGAYEAVNIMSTPAMDWTEYTQANIAFWYCHQIFDDCSLLEDFCHVQITTESGTEILGPIPMGSGYVELDVSDLVGHSTVKLEFVEQTDWIGTIAIDNVVVSAYDGEKPVTISDLALTRVAGSKQVDLTWTAPIENEYILSPPAEPLANIYQFRYSKDPILDPSDWRDATPFVPNDQAAGSSIPAPPGSAESASFEVPSATQTYYVAMMAQDEVNNATVVSNSPGDPGDSTSVVFGVSVLSLDNAVAAPGDTAMLHYQVTNLGNVADSYSLTATDTAGWDLSPNPAFLLLGAGASEVHRLSIIVPGSASGGDADTVSVTATSLSDPTATDSDAGIIDVDAPDAIAGELELPLVASLRMAGSNPFRNSLRMTLSLPRTARTNVLLFDSSGRLVRELLRSDLAAGQHPVSWDGRDQQGRDTASGIYYLEARTGDVRMRMPVMRVK